MPKDSAPTRSAILAAAVQALKRNGLEGFAIEQVARRAAVAKGLVLYHFRSRNRLLGLCAAQIAGERRRRLTKILEGAAGAAAVDACWEELRCQQEDGLARAWLGLSAAGIIDRSHDDERFEEIARELLFDGCAAALASGVPLPELKDAFNASWLALLDIIEEA